MLSDAEYKRLMAAVQHEVRDGAILFFQLVEAGVCNNRDDDGTPSETA